MITDKNVALDSKYKRFDFLLEGKSCHFYYVDPPSENGGENSSAILAANDLKFAFSEWWDFYRCRAARLKQAGIDGIPIITKEEAIMCGL